MAAAVLFAVFFSGRVFGGLGLGGDGGFLGDGSGGRFFGNGRGRCRCGTELCVLSPEA